MTATASSPPTTLPRLSLNAAIIGGVVLAHGAALWALNTGLLHRVVEVVVPAQILAEFIAPPPPPAPQPEPVVQTPPPAPPAAPPVAKPVPPKPRPAPRPRPAPAPAPQPLAVAEAAPTAPVVHMAPPGPPDPAPVLAPEPPAPSPPAPPAAAPVVVQPSSSAAHLSNAPPPYPPMSRRLGESGRVVVRVLIGPDGRAQQAHIQRSSGFERLDQVALETARDRWRYRPGTRNGVPEAMWFNVPLNFVLE